MKLKFIIGFFFLFCYCQQKSEIKLLKIVKVKELKIKPEVMMSPVPALARLIESDSGKHLFFLNHISKKLQFLNLENGRIAKEIITHYDGPNNMSNRSGVALIEQDKIWATFAPHSIGYLNYEGEIEFKKNIPPGEVNISFLGSDFHQELHRYEYKVFGVQPLFMDHHRMAKEDIYKHSLIYSYDMSTDQTEWLDVYYAEDYWDVGKKLSNFSWARREDKLYISPWYDHEIQVFDMQQEKVVGKVKVESDYINSFYYVNKIPGSIEEGQINHLSHDLYGIILYDKYRDCFYRFFYPGYTDEKENTLEKLGSLHRSRPFTGVMVLDKDLNVLGEHVFHKFEVHASSNVFVGEEGLYLSLNNENSPDYDEDHLRYIVIRFDLER